MSVDKILIIENVTKRFGGLVAIDNVYFEVEKGEFIGLIGPNGAGKTTLFNVINGIYKPESGRIIFKRIDITKKPPHDIANLGIARTYQVVKPFKDMNVVENAMIGALYGKKHGKISIEEAKEIAMNTIEMVGLKDKADVIASSLTLHEKKMLELARALSAEPDILLLDEVLAGLNLKEIEESLKIISTAKEKLDLTIIMVEHIMHAVMNIAERLIVLHYGKKIAEGSPMEVAEMSSVITAYLGDKELALKYVKHKKGGG